MVKTSPSNTGGVGSIPGQGAKIPHASWPKNQNRSNIVTNSIKTLKMVHIKKKNLKKKRKKCLSVYAPQLLWLFVILWVLWGLQRYYGYS